jgi:hypothetical protein
VLGLPTTLDADQVSLEIDVAPVEGLQFAQAQAGVERGRPDRALEGRERVEQRAAVAAGVADHVWKLDEIIALLDEAERAVPIKRGPYKPRQPRAISN